MENVRKISKKYYLREIVACFLVSCLFFNAPVALAEVVLTANPVGTILVDPVVPAVGDYAFTQSMSASDGSIGEFSNFDIASDLFVTCTQPSTTSNALFQVDSPDGTQILGRFDATGNVYLRDGGGFFIGVDGIVNANRFVASTLAIDNVEWQAFIGGPISNKLKFGPGGADPGAVTENTGTITAPDGVYLVGPQVLNSGTINSDLVVMAAGEKVYLKHGVDSKVYIETPSDLLTPDPAFNKVDNSGTINTSGQVLLAAGDIFSTALNAGSLAATANRDITLTGAVQTTGDIELTAAHDVQIKEDVTTGGNLSIEATSGSIDAKGATIFMDSDDKTLTITQNASIAMETGFTVSNSEETDLVATSTGGLFTSAAAPDWQSITVSANGDITLNDMLSGGDITTNSLTAGGNIDVTSNHGKVEAYGAISAGQDVKITATDETPDSILLRGAGRSISAGQDIWLNNNTHADGPTMLVAGQDVRLGYNENLDKYDAKTLTTAGNLTVAADRHITFGGDVTAQGDMLLVGDADYDDTGDVTTQGLTTTASNIIINGQNIETHGAVDSTGAIQMTADDDITLHDYAKAVGSIWLRADMDSDGVIGGDVLAESYLETIFGDIWITGDNIEVLGTVTSGSVMRMFAADNITLHDAATAVGDMTLVGDNTPDETGDVTTDSLTTSPFGNISVSGQNIEINGAVSSAGDVTMTAQDDITLHESALAAGSMQLHANTDLDGVIDGDVLAESTLDATTGGMLVTGENITLQGAATSGATMTIIGDTDADETGDVTTSSLTTNVFGDISVSGQNIETNGAVDSDGSIMMGADDDITLHDYAKAVGHIWLHADTDTDGVIGGDVLAESYLETTFGQIVVTGDNIEVLGTVTSGSDIQMSADDDITLHSTATANGDLTLSAVDDVTAKGNLNASGNIDIYSSDDTTYLGGDLVYAIGNITLHNNTELNGSGDQTVDAETGTLDIEKNIDKTEPGSMTLAGGTGIEVGGNVRGSGMTSSDSIIFEDAVTADGTGAAEDQRFDADAGALHADSTITKTTTGDLYLGGDTDIDLDGTVDVDDGSLTIEDDFSAAADLIASENVTLEGDATLDGSVNQKIEATTGSLYANGWVHKTDTGDLDMFGGFEGPWSTAFSVWTNEVRVEDGELSIRGDGSVTMRGAIYSTGDMLLSANDDEDVSTGILHHYAPSSTIESLNGQIDMSATGSEILLYGGPSMPDTYVSAGDDILLRDDTKINGNRKLYAGDDVVLAGGMDITYNGGGPLTIEAGDDILLGVANVDSHWIDQDSGSAGNVSVDGDLTLTAGDDIHAHGQLLTEPDSGGNITATAGDDIHLYNTPTSAEADGTLTLTADIDEDDGTVYVGGDISANGGNMEITGANIKIKGDVYANGDIGMNAHETGYQWFNLGNVWVKGNIESTGNVDIVADDHITLGESFLWWTENGNVDADGHVRLMAYADEDGYFGEVKVAGDIDAGGFVVIDALDDSTIHLWGDIDADDYIWLMADTEFEGWDDQYLDAGTWIQADGYLNKLNSFCYFQSDGSLYLHAHGDEYDGDISLAGDVTAATDCEDCPGYGGGVSIISDNGKIFTPDDGDNDTLNVAITGRSVDAALLDEGEEGIGVHLPDLPDGPGRAAIVIQSAAELKLGPGAELQASGMYDNTGIVDDRQGVAFLHEPAAIGGVDRDEGDPIDVAIYVASTDSDVDVSSKVTITSCPPVEGPPENKGTMVIDARDTVTFDGGVPGGLFETSLADGKVGDRLEVVSRISEWLFQASGRLPYVGGGGPFQDGYEYVLRGAGQGNPAIAAVTDGKGPAWVLEDPILPPPLYTETGEAAEEQGFGEGGCPALMNWLAGELGIEEDQIEVTVANAFAYSTDIQPCEMCARLRDAATILEDAEGTGVASLVQVVNEFVATPTPPSEEQMASIATAFADHTDDGTYYAAAGEWIDALVEYVGILTFEMGYSADESTTYANKYIGPVTDTGNASLVAYVQARLAALGG